MNKILSRFTSLKHSFQKSMDGRKYNIKGIPIDSKEPLLNVVGVKKKFSIQGRIIPVLNDVNFQVNRGETLAITGASGSGKTTLLNLLAGIDIPTAGEICFYQYPFNQLTESYLATLRSQYIGFVFQQNNLIKELTVKENVLIPAMIHPSFAKMKKEKENLALELLGKVGLHHRLDHYSGELSGGEAQRVAIVRAFINNPLLILADEPTGNLDQQNSSDVFSLLSHFARSHSTAVVMVTHSPDLSKRCDRTYKIINKVLELGL